MLGRTVEVVAQRALCRVGDTRAQLHVTSTLMMAVCAVRVEIALVFHSPCQRARLLRRAAAGCQTPCRTTRSQACRADPSLERCLRYTAHRQVFLVQVAQEIDTIP